MENKKEKISEKENGKKAMPKIKIWPLPVPAFAIIAIAALVLLLAFAPAIFAQSPPTTTAQASFIPWQATAFAAALASFFIIALAYMIGHGFEMPMLEIWAKQEIFQAIVTMIFILLLVTGVDSFSRAIAADAATQFQHDGASLGFSSELTAYAVQLNKLEGGQGSAIDFAMFYTQSQISYLAYQYNQMNAYSIQVGRVSTVSGYCYALSAGGFSIMEGRYLSDTQGSLGGAVSAVSAGLTAMEGQYFLLKIFQNSMFALLLPLGIILRSFSYTRSAGGLLLALAIGFYIVFPLMVIVEYNIFADYAGHEGAASVSIPGLPMPTNNRFGEVQENGYVDALVSPGFFEPLVFRTVIISVLLPTLKIFITLTFVRWFAVIMGADVDVSSLVRMG